MAIVLALAFVPAALAVGAALDYARAATARSALRAAVDAAALAAARETDQSPANLRAVVERYLRANFQSELHGTLGALEVQPGTTTLTVRARASVPTSLMRLGGLERMEVAAETEVVLSGVNLEVALVLDVTGSMAQGTKLPDLKAAATDLVNILIRDVASPFYTKISLVPYSMGVNVGMLANTVRGSVSPGECTSPGCEYFKFRNPYNEWRSFRISTCVSERIGPHAYTDAPPSVAPVGRNYPAPSNPCLSSQLLPLTTNKAQLLAAIAGLSASGSTAGHVGVAWGWYTLSPNFGVWTGSSRPGPYGREDTQKILVLMTDGEYNSSYCNGVIARNSTTGSGDPRNHINCDAPNGHSFDQAQRLCTAIKQNGIIVFTVGFQIVDDPRARALMSSCATSPQHAYTAETGAQLRQAFQQIANRISNLRISR
ncbi:MAG: VWA domain-containing protein [Geminicoccaceae bacterium]|nr:VWA domain-containing protein [Geminicoccaceae bacterium]MCX7629929.1 VWA domain-containing protein [Geminicoccaceae bacterium]